MGRGKFRPRITTWDLFGSEESADDPVFYDDLILAEGDSWFTIGGLFAQNLLMNLRFERPTLILSCASPGDTIVHMSALAHNHVYKEALRYDYPWKAILLSGGGNDLIDRADEIVLDKNQRKGRKITGPKDYCDEEKLLELITEVKSGYRTLVSVRDASGASGVPVIVHTYDYPTPRNSPARFIIGNVGPWIYPALVHSKVPRTDWISVSDYLFDALADGITGLSAEQPDLANFHVVKTRGLLKRASEAALGDDADWLNEIHPNDDGYKKLAKKLEQTLIPLLNQ